MEKNTENSTDIGSDHSTDNDRNKKKQNLFRRRLIFSQLLILFTMGILIGMVVFFSRKTGLFALLISVVTMGITGGAFWYSRKHIYESLFAFVAKSEQLQTVLLDELSQPYAIIDRNCRILWMNQQFKLVLGTDNVVGKKLSTFFREFSKKIYPDQEMSRMVTAVYEKKQYQAEIKTIDTRQLSSECILIEEPYREDVLYTVMLSDVTELEFMKKELRDNKPVVALIYFDNLEEVMQTLDPVRQSMLLALIEKRLNRYFQTMDALVRSLEKGKYIVVLTQKNLEELEETRFRILTDVKGINVGNDTNVTLSIGVGVSGDSYAKNAEMARIATELALGRGGDQAVVKSKKGISYYGGNSQGMEKNTRVKARVKAHALHEFIQNKDRVVIMGHRNMDMDCLGAAIGLYRAARSIDKPAYIVVGEQTGANMLPWLELLRKDKEHEDDPFISHEIAEQKVDNKTVLIVVDTNKPSMTEHEILLKKTDTIVVLDHHRQAEEKIGHAVLSYIEQYASSASEMVAEILQYFEDGVKLKNCEADCIYAGMYVDTNNFTTKTGVRTFEAAAYLRRSGADVTRVKKMFREKMENYQVRADVVRSAKLFREYYMISRLDSDQFTLDNPSVVGAQAANELLGIEGIRASFVLTKMKNCVGISARAIDEGNVQVVMEQMGGGGHMNIAGVQLKDTTLDEAEKQLEAVLTDMIDKGAI